MRCFSNSTTARLEAFARARGLDYGVLKSPDNARGVFFLTRIRRTVLNRWIPLGYTALEARENIRESSREKTLGI